MYVYLSIYHGAAIYANTHIYICIYMYVYASMYVCMHLSHYHDAASESSVRGVAKRRRDSAGWETLSDVIYVYTHTHTYIYICIYMYVYLDSQSHSRISSQCVCARVPFEYKPSVYLPIFVSLYVCMRVCMYLSIDLTRRGERVCCSVGGVAKRRRASAGWETFSDVIYVYTRTHTHIYMHIYVCVSRLPKPLSDQFPVRVCSCPLCI